MKQNLHDYLLNLKNKNSMDPDIDSYKKEIRARLKEYRSNQPCPPTSLLFPQTEEK